ncbi:MAG: Peptidoglycan glycosyltransferase [Patescibacteria group bacterium]|nr:Peptidoglycan glycosyltransferase [Patescibacteria group bacterium]
MNDPNSRPRRRQGSNTYTTRSGKTIKLNRSMGDRIRHGKEAKAQRKAAYLSSLPAQPWKRALYRLSPKRMYHYWFSREGGLMALKLAGVGLVVGFLTLVGVFAYFRKDLPRIRDISGNNFGGSVTYYDRTGKTALFQDYNERKRVPVEDKEISKYMKMATIAIEDKDFYKHGAFDTRGIVRALYVGVKGGGRQGGSTITQQLVKLNEGWTNERTVTRKIKELILAVELEREYSKNEILTGYLNMAPYGNVDYGVETAARDYFGKSAKDLTIAESSMLAAIPKAPGAWSPFSDPKYNPALTQSTFDSDGLLTRQHYILDRMVEQGYITEKESKDAKKTDILATIKPLRSYYDGIQAPYFVLAAKQELQKTFPAAVVSRGGWRVITTVDLNMQKIADEAVQNGSSRLRWQGADSVGFVAEDNETGQVLAVVGGKDFNNPEYGKINYATQVNISPGSTIKPYDYAAFIDNNTNVGAGSVLYDSMNALPGYPCTNRALPERGGNCLFDFDRKAPGPTTLRYALGGSRNIPAAKAFVSSVPNDTSPGRVKSINKTMSVINGLMATKANDGYRCFKSGTDVTNPQPSDETQCYTAAAIGDGAYLNLDNHVNGIASIARMGKAIPQTYILKVTNSSGKTLKEYKQTTPKQVIKQDTAYIVSDMASDPKASYLNGYCSEQSCSGLKFHRYKGWKNSIKTGTTNDKYDGLMVSWNKKFSAGIWVGNHSRTVAFGGQPETMTGPIMKEFMQRALDTAGKADNNPQPAGIKTDQAFMTRSSTGGGQSLPSPSTDIFPSWYSGRRSGSTTQVIDKITNTIATACTPTLAKQTGANSNAASWNVDVFAGGNAGSSSPVTTKDTLHQCSDTKPTVSITAVNGASRSSGSLSCNGSCSVMVRVEQGTHALTDSSRAQYPGTLSLTVNGQQVQTQNVAATGDYTLTFSMPPDTTTANLSVTIVDSALYDASDTATVSAPAQPAVTPSADNSGNSNNSNSTRTVRSLN